MSKRCCRNCDKYHDGLCVEPDWQGEPPTNMFCYGHIMRDDGDDLCNHCGVVPCRYEINEISHHTSDSIHMESEDISIERLAVFQMISAERDRQNKIWGVSTYRSIFEGMCCLGEEYGELCEALNETFDHSNKRPELGGKDNIIKEACQVAAVCVKLIEGLMKNEIKLE